VRVGVSDDGAVYFSIPGKGSEPTLLRFAAGQLQTVLTADANVTGIGVLTRPHVIDVNAHEDVLLTTPVTSGTQKPLALGVLRGNAGGASGLSFTEIARVGDADGSNLLTRISPVGVDDQGNALFVADIGATLGATTTLRSLRFGPDTQHVLEVAREGTPLAAGDLTLLTLDEWRVNRTGDVAFTAEFGTSDASGNHVQELRAVVRRADGTVRTVLSSMDTAIVGSVVKLSLTSFNDDGVALVLANGSRSGERVLVIAPSAPSM
jgi:hypothetical protein